MALELIVGILIKVAQELLTTKLAEGLDSLAQSSPVQNALKEMAADPEVDAQIVPLKKWAQSDEFAEMLDRIAAGERTLTDDAIAETFVEATGFYAGEATATRKAARALLHKFSEWIEYYLYESRSGRYLQMKRLEQLHQERAFGEQSILEVAQETNSKVSEIARVVLPSDAPVSQGSHETTFHGQLDIARDLINSGKTTTALQVLKRIRESLNDKAPTVDLQYRIATNMGACYLDLGDSATALKEFMRARTLKPQSAQAQANAATAAIGSGHATLALDCSEIATSIAPNDPHARAVRLWATHEFDRPRFDQLRNAINSDDPSPELCLMLGELLLSDESYEEAEAWLKRGIALSAGTEHPDAHSLLAVAIFRPVQLRLANMVPHLARIPTEDRSRLEEAEEELTQAVAALENRETRDRLVTALSNRGAIRSLLGHKAEARQDLDRALAESPANVEALFNRALLAFVEDDEATAVRLFRRIPKHETNPDIVLPLAASLGTLGSHEEAIRLLNRFGKVTRMIRISCASQIFCCMPILGSTRTTLSDRYSTHSEPKQTMSRHASASWVATPCAGGTPKRASLSCEEQPNIPRMSAN